MIGFFFRTRHILFRIYHIYTLKNEYNDKYSAIFQPFVNFGVSSIYFCQKYKAYILKYKAHILK